jgi:hypothetical protein
MLCAATEVIQLSEASRMVAAEKRIVGGVFPFQSSTAWVQRELEEDRLRN